MSPAAKLREVREESRPPLGWTVSEVLWTVPASFLVAVQRGVWWMQDRRKV